MPIRLPGSHRFAAFLLAMAVAGVVMLVPAGASRAEGDAAAGSCAAASGPSQRLRGVSARNELLLDDGRSVRLAGLDLALPPPEGASWSEFLETLARNASLRLGAVSGPDRWGRTNAQVFVKPDEAESEAWLQGYLLDTGSARLLPEAEARSCWGAMIEAETAARKQKRGLWTASGAVFSSDRPADIFKKRGELAMVEGKIIGIGESRAVFYLNFGRSWRNDFTVIVLKRQMKQFESAGLKISELVDKSVRVRGIVDGQYGPRIEASMPEQIEKLD
ncbi:MAG: hypothetical protein K2P80_14045 [Beijerinckiaceae bacterium]|nr:hypothetical protein [Beijerinckiaceae bacterium]